MPRLRNQGKYGCPTYNQAQKIIARFGGEAKFAKMIGISRITAFRWQYARPYGSDGLIPTANIETIRAVARMEGILLRAEDWLPEKVKYNEDRTPYKRTVTSYRKSLADLMS